MVIHYTKINGRDASGKKSARVQDMLREDMGQGRPDVLTRLPVRRQLCPICREWEHLRDPLLKAG